MSTVFLSTAAVHFRALMRSNLHGSRPPHCRCCLRSGYWDRFLSEIRSVIHLADRFSFPTSSERGVSNDGQHANSLSHFSDTFRSRRLTGCALRHAGGLVAPFRRMGSSGGRNRDQIAAALSSRASGINAREKSRCSA